MTARACQSAPQGTAPWKPLEIAAYIVGAAAALSVAGMLYVILRGRFAARR